MYAVAIDDRLKLVTVTIGGLLSEAEAKRYVADVGKAFVAHHLRSGYLMMIDISQASVQSQEVVAAFQSQIAHFPKARRIAIVTGSSLARMQVRRVMTQSYARVFRTEAEGRAWLVAPQAVPA